jgi:hypothetical protein
LIMAVPISYLIFYNMYVKWIASNEVNRFIRVEDQ